MQRLVLTLVLVGGCAQGASRERIDNGDAAIPPADGVTAPRDVGGTPIDATPPLDATPPIDAPAMIDAAPLPPDACVPATVELLANPVFDLSPLGVNWVSQPIDPSLAIITSDGYAGDTAPYKAWLGGVDGASLDVSTVTDVLYQDVVVPALTTNLVLTYKYAVGTQDSTTTKYDTALLSATQTNGTEIAKILEVDNRTTNAMTWTAATYMFTQNLSGQTVRLRMTSTNDVLYASNFFFDTMSLKATHGCP